MSLPELTVDMDGVLCRPVLWMNLAISRDVVSPPAFPDRKVGGGGSRVRRVADSGWGQVLRYGWRAPIPHVRDGLAELATMRRLVLLSGRPEGARRATEAWLRRHGLRDFFGEVILNDLGLPNVSFKLLKIRERGGSEHVDDDGRVAYFLANEGSRRIFLIAYHGNAGLPYPPGVARVESLREAAQLIRQSRDPTP
jgi:hypothetical protein